MEPELKEMGNYSHLLRFFCCCLHLLCRHWAETLLVAVHKHCPPAALLPGDRKAQLQYFPDGEHRFRARRPLTHCTRGREHQDEYVQSTEGTAESLNIQKAFDFNLLEKFGKVEYQPSETSFMHNRSVQTQTSAAEGWGLSPARVRQKAGEGHGAEAAAPRRALPTSRQRGAVFSSELLPGHLFTEIMLLFWERLFLCLPNKWK